MENKEKLSNQGLLEIDAAIAKKLKKNYLAEISSKFNIAPEGYFIGKALLGKILFENDDAAGILISFGLNAPTEKGGLLQLIVEPASGKKAKDNPKIINKSVKYATLDDGGTDGLLPMIKPKPPQ